MRHPAGLELEPRLDGIAVRWRTGRAPSLARRLALNGLGYVGTLVAFVLLVVAGGPVGCVVGVPIGLVGLYLLGSAEDPVSRDYALSLDPVGASLEAEVGGFALRWAEVERIERRDSGCVLVAGQRRWEVPMAEAEGRDWLFDELDRWRRSLDRDGEADPRLAVLRGAPQDQSR